MNDCDVILENRFLSYFLIELINSPKIGTKYVVYNKMSEKSVFREA